jgi:creatinine amidohydrolase/Fe(II)-dependent formamide hydrolase-like protein
MKTKVDCFWIRNTDRTLPRLCKASGRVAVLPLTSIESHGPHLPLGWVIEHPYMAVGTPQKATRAKGEKAAEIWAQGMVDQLRQIKRDRRGPAVWAQYWKRVNTVRFQGGR